MNTAQTIESSAQMRALADVHRLTILQRLMAERATLSQLADRLHHSPAWVRHHLLVLEKAGLVELAEIRKSGRVTEKYYQAKAAAYLIQQWVLPKSDKPLLIFCGSHDLALEQVTEMISKHLQLVILPVGSLTGLINLRQGICQLAGAHIFDKQTGEYNIPTLQQLFPDRSLQVITLAQRTQGLILAPGNPKGIAGLEDLARPDIRFVNRNEGSGTRLWLDEELRRLGILPAQINGYFQQLNTHAQTARYVVEGQADVTLGLHAAAFRYGLDFIPLFEERYDLVFQSQFQNALNPLLDLLQATYFQRQLQSLPGYNNTHSGEHIQLERK